MEKIYISKYTGQEVDSILDLIKNRSFLSRVSEDETNYLIKFLSGLHVGYFLKGSNGIGMYQDENNKWHIEADYLDARLNPSTPGDVSFSELFEKVQLANGTWAIRAKFGLFSDSFISAKGANTNGGSTPSGGASALYQLNDVAKNSSADGVLGAAKGSLLSYDGTHWYAIPQSSVMPNLSGYATQLWVEGKGYSTKSELNTAISAVNATIDKLSTEVEGKLDASVFNELFEKVTLEDGKTQAIRAKLGLYTDSFLSAKGANGNGTSSGSAAALYQLNDVLADGNKVQGASVGSLLAYNGSHWYAIAQSSITPDLSAYAKKTDIPTIPTKVSAFENDANYATTSDLDTRIDALVNGAPQAYDTLKEIADVLAGNVNSISDILTALGNKADKATTLSGYGIIDAYTITQIDSIVNGLSGNISTLQGYFTDGVANSALKLSDNGSYKAWGQTFFTNGKPKSVSGNLHIDNSKVYWLSDSDNFYIDCLYDGVRKTTMRIMGHYGHTFMTSNGDVVSITQTGNVLIGTTTNSGYKLDVNGETRVTKLVIGNGSIEWDETNKGFKIVGGLYTESYLSAKGANTNGGSSSGGGLIESLWKVGDLGKTFNTNANDTFNAYAINAIHNRVSVLEGKATNVSFTQSLTSGTQIGTITIDGVSKAIYAPTIPTSDINKGVTAYGWGNHATMGYITASASITGNAASASLIKPTTGTGVASSWVPLTSYTKVWSEAFNVSSLGSDTGDIVLYLRSGVYTKNSAELCVAIDGDFYAQTGSKKVLHEGNYTDYAYSKTTIDSKFSGLGTFAYKSSLAFADLTNKPTTISGYGITDAITTANIGSQSVASLIQDGVTDLNSVKVGTFFQSSLNATNLPSGANRYLTGFSLATDNNLEYRVMLGLDYSGNVFARAENGGKWKDWKTIAFTDSNVASATKLQTTRSIWGQSFDGTGDVSGDLSGVGIIQFSNAKSFNIRYNGFYPTSNSEDYWWGVSRYDTNVAISVSPVSGVFQTRYETYLAIASGNVGIGTTSPSQKLDVNGSISIADKGYISVGANRFIYHGKSTNNVSSNLTIIASGSEKGGSVQIRPYDMDMESNSTTFLSNGNVLIGTTTDSGYKLHVKSTATALMCESTASESSIYFSASSENAYRWAIGKGVWNIGGDFGIGEYNTAKKLFFRIAKNGNVGIGLSYTTAPSYKLHINGTLHASDAVSFGSTLDVTGAITKPTTSGSNMTSNYISAGGGYSSGTGKYGVKILCCDQADAQTGLGQDLGDLTGGYELSVVGGTSSGGKGYISFVTHGVNSTSYRKLGYFYDNKGVISFDVLGTIHSTTGIWSDGYVSAKGQNTSSDMRLKNVLNEVVLGVKDIANAPSLRFSWKNGGGVDVGSSAQYWQKLLPDAVKERDGMLEMQYANIALLSAIAIAKNVETHEERIARLEKENKELRNEINSLRYGA